MDSARSLVRVTCAAGRSGRWPCLTALVVMSGCHGAPRPQSVAPTVRIGAGAAALALPSVWTFPGSDVPAFCLVLREGGRAEFEGGFRFFNPVRWTWAPDHRLSLTIPALSARELPSLLEHVADGQLLGYDSTTKTLTLALNPDAVSFFLFGYNLFRPTSLTAEQIAPARRRCPSLPR